MMLKRHHFITKTMTRLRAYIIESSTDSDASVENEDNLFNLDEETIASEYCFITSVVVYNISFSLRF